MCNIRASDEQRTVRRGIKVLRGVGEAGGELARSKTLTNVELFGQDLSNAEREKKEEAHGLRTTDYELVICYFQLTRYLQQSPPRARHVSSVISTSRAPHILSACLYQPMTVMQSAVE